MKNRLSLIVAISTLALGLMTGCSQIPGLSSLVGNNQGSEQSGKSETRRPESIKEVQGVSLTLAKDTSFTLFTVYRSNYFDFYTGADSPDDDFGQIEIMSYSGLQNSEDNGFFIYGRQFVKQKVHLGFIEKGDAAFDSISEAPEYGWSSATPGNRNKVKIEPGKVYLLRAQYPDIEATYYGKVWIKDISPDNVTFDYSYNRTAGDRRL